MSACIGAAPVEPAFVRRSTLTAAGGFMTELLSIETSDPPHEKQT
jgi:hypothetical protein